MSTLENKKHILEHVNKHINQRISMSTAEVINFYHAKQGVNMDNFKKGYI